MREMLILWRNRVVHAPIAQVAHSPPGSSRMVNQESSTVQLLPLPRQGTGEHLLHAAAGMGKVHKLRAENRRREVVSRSAEHLEEH